MRYKGEDYFFLKNHLGSIAQIVDVYQAEAKSYQYDAFGNILSESGSLSHNAFQYTAREYHSRSGLYYYRARWYSPQLGRFLTQDPIGHLGGVNLYAYVGNDPVDWIDPFGLAECERWQKVKDGAVFVRDWVMVPGLSAYGTYLLGEWNPYAVVAIPLVKFGGAMWMYSVEQEYQSSRAALIDTTSRAQVGGVDALVISGHLTDVERVSDAGTKAAWFLEITPFCPECRNS